MKHLVVGASGLLGRYVCDLLNEKYRKVIGTYSSNSYLVRKENCPISLSAKEYTDTVNKVQAIDPDIIWICSSLTDVNYCERHPQESYDVNVKFVDAILKGASESATIIYYSTDYVFRGSGRKDEFQTPNPANQYGRDKLLAEHLVLSQSSPKRNTYIFRTSHLFGVHPGEKNFASRVLKSYREDLPIFNVRKNQIDTPIFAKTLAEESYAQVSFKNNGVTKISHIVGDKQISRKDFAQFLVDNFPLDSRNPSRTSDFKIIEKEFSETVERPNGGLTTEHIGSVISFDKCLDEFKTEYRCFVEMEMLEKSSY